MRADTLLDSAESLEATLLDAQLEPAAALAPLESLLAARQGALGSDTTRMLGAALGGLMLGGLGSRGWGLDLDDIVD